MFKVWVKEPLVHFFVLGLCIFVVYAQVSPITIDTQRLVISQRIQIELIRQFESIWSRSPTTQEQIRLIDNYLRDEVLYREGVSIGLLQDDIVIKRRVRQKLEMLMEMQYSESTDTELRNFIAQNPVLFMKPARITFEQIIFKPADYNEPIEEVIERTKKQLLVGKNLRSVGSRSTLPKIIELQDSIDIEKTFGNEFLNASLTQDLGIWQGPISSPYGKHLLRVDKRIDSYLPELDEVRQLAEREWSSQRKKQNFEDNLQIMKAKYKVIIEPIVVPK